jgi:hypothetical protein
MKRNLEISAEVPTKCVVVSPKDLCDASVQTPAVIGEQKLKVFFSQNKRLTFPLTSKMVDNFVGIFMQSGTAYVQQKRARGRKVFANLQLGKK